MATILRKDLYEATWSAAKEIFARPSALDPFFMMKNAGETLRRYVSYRRNQPQEEKAARQIWNPLENDTKNRWTGLGTDGRGSQGLYMSGEVINEHQPFPELEHYQDPAIVPTQEIECVRFERGKDPIYINVPGSELRTLIRFFLTKTIKGIDFSLKVNGNDHPLLIEILELVKQRNSGVLRAEDSMKNLYLSREDASFTRAIGNALFELESIDFFQATSVRDEMSHNIILKATYGTSIDYIKAMDRGTFLVDSEGKRGVSVHALHDLAYNYSLWS
jgi:hypothetical protein